MSRPTLITYGTRPAVRLERDLADPPPVVWRALTEREQLGKWFPCDVIVDGDWTAGSAITFDFAPQNVELTFAGEVLEVDPPRRLVFSFGEELLRFELIPRNDGTRLVLIDELPPGIAARNAVGWEDCLDVLAGATPQSSPWRVRFDAYAAEFEPTLGTQEGPPAGFDVA